MLRVIAAVAALALAPAAAAGEGGAGRVVSEAQLRGKHLLAYFGYTHCPDICPTGLADMAAALERMGPRAAALQPVFVTVDPARDTAELMAAYVAHFHPRLVGLTGPPPAMARLVRRYRIAVRRLPSDDGDYLIDHSAKFLLIGPEGEVMASWPQGIRPDQLARALLRLLPGD